MRRQDVEAVSPELKSDIGTHGAGAEAIDQLYSAEGEAAEDHERAEQGAPDQPRSGSPGRGRIILGQETQQAEGGDARAEGQCRTTRKRRQRAARAEERAGHPTNPVDGGGSEE